MKKLSALFQQLDQEFILLKDTIEIQQIVFSILILFIGFFAVHYLFQVLKRLLVNHHDKIASPFWSFTHYALPIKLICYLGIIRLAELPIDFQPMQIQVFHFIESLLVALSFLVALLIVISQIYQRVVKPSKLFQDTEAVHHLSILKNLSRILVVIGIASGFVFAQQSAFTNWFLASSWWKYFLAGVLIILFWILSLTISKLLLRISATLGHSKEHIRLRLILSSLLWPVRLLVIVLIGYSIKTVFELPENVNMVLGYGIIVLSTLSGFLLIYNLLDVIDNEMYKLVERDDNLLDKTFAQMVRLVLRLIVLTIAAIYLIQALSGKPVSALLAGLGIGALAVALAAQDTLKNLFGSVMIMADKPFEIGQRILVDGFDGVVEAIGFRSTRVRTLTGNQVSIPNEKMASQSIENIGRRPHIRRLTNIGITYDTPPDKVEKALEMVRGILENHEGMDPEFPPRVYFSEFNDYSLNLLMIYWYQPADYWQFMEFSEKVNLRIMKAFEAEGIEFAFPTSTTYLAQDDRRPLSIDIKQ